MTIEEFMKNYNIKKKETVVKWISDQLIPGASLSKDYVPNSARPPYTKARAKTADSIYYSIIKGTRNRLHVLPQIYKICPEEFNTYIEQLEKAELIVRRITDDITYYDLTMKAMNCTKKMVLDIIRSCSEGIAKGITAAMVEQSKSA